MDRTRRLLSDVALFTGIPANIFALIPVILTLLSKLEFIAPIHFDIEPIIISLDENVTIPVRESVFVLVLYGFLAVLFSITFRLKILSEKAVNIQPKTRVKHLRQFISCTVLLLTIPVTLLLAVFGFIDTINMIVHITVMSFVYGYVMLISDQGQRQRLVRGSYSSYTEGYEWVGFRDFRVFFFLLTTPALLLIILSLSQNNLLSSLGIAIIYSFVGYIEILVLQFLIMVYYLWVTEYPIAIDGMVYALQAIVIALCLGAIMLFIGRRFFD